MTRGVAAADQAQREIQLRPGGFRAARDVDVDVASEDAGAGEGVGLVRGVLLSGGDPGVADEHPPDLPSTTRPKQVFRR